MRVKLEVEIINRWEGGREEVGLLKGERRQSQSAEREAHRGPNCRLAVRFASVRSPRQWCLVVVDPLPLLPFRRHLLRASGGPWPLYAYVSFPPNTRFIAGHDQYHE